MRTGKIWLVCVAMTISLSGCSSGAESAVLAPSPVESEAPIPACETDGTPVPRPQCDLSKLQIVALCKTAVSWRFVFRNPTPLWVNAQIKVANAAEPLDGYGFGGVEPGTSTYDFDVEGVNAPFTLVLVMDREGPRQELGRANAPTVPCPNDQGKIPACANPRLTGEEVQVRFRVSGGEIYSSWIGVFNAAEEEAVPLERRADGVYAGSVEFVPAFYADLHYSPNATVEVVGVDGVACS